MPLPSSRPLLCSGALVAVGLAIVVSSKVRRCGRHSPNGLQQSKDENLGDATCTADKIVAIASSPIRLLGRSPRSSAVLRDVMEYWISRAFFRSICMETPVDVLAQIWRCLDTVSGDRAALVKHHKYGTFEGTSFNYSKPVICRL